MGCDLQCRPVCPGLNGRQLLIHEQAHVVQQQESLPHPATGDVITRPGDPSEQAADRMAGDIISILRAPDRTGGVAVTQAGAVPNSLHTGTVCLQRVVNEQKVGCRTSGIPPRGITGEQAVAAIRNANEAAIRMAQPAEVSLFVERLTYGDVPPAPAFTRILREEPGLDITDAAHRTRMEVVKRRFELIRTKILESCYTGHTCIGAAAVSPGTGTPAACAGTCCNAGTRACSCTGVSHIVLCRPWWTTVGTDSRPGRLVHESLHIYFGFIGNFTSRMTDAHCYTAFAERLPGVRLQHVIFSTGIPRKDLRKLHATCRFFIAADYFPAHPKI